MSVKGRFFRRFFKIQGGLADKYTKLPGFLQKLLISSIARDKRLQHTDELMKLILGINMSLNIASVAHDIRRRRSVFKNRNIGLQGANLPNINYKKVIIPSPAQPIKGKIYTANHDSDTQKPCILYLHGGAYSIGSIQTHNEFCQYLCQYTQMTVLSIDYRLAPEHPAPAALDDGVTALEWLHKNYQAHNIDNQKIYIAGDGSGGNLATVIAQQTKETLIAPKAQLLIYPMTDHSKFYKSYHVYGRGLVLTYEDKQQCEYFYIHSGELKVDDPRISPMNGDVTKVAPAYIITAELDLLVDEGEAYAHKLKAANVHTHSERFTGLPHGFLHLMNIHPACKHASINIAKGFKKFVADL